MASVPICVLDYEKYALERLPKPAIDYYRSGANQEQTVNDNRTAYLRWRILPRMLRDVSQRSMSTTILNRKVSAPIGSAPTAMQRMAHPEGECAAAKAAAAQGLVYILSTIATSSIEEIAEAAPDGYNWFQLYIYKDRQVTRNLVKRAEQAGFKAIVLTVDAPYFGLRLADVRNKFALPDHLKMANFDAKDPEGNLVKISKGGSGINEYVKSLFDASITWQDVDWLRSLTSLPIVIKGILTRQDAELAIQHGASAIVVSNHGGRQIDGAPATIDVLPSIVDTVKGRCEIYVDGGVTQGTDIFKALALGAKMVLVGRPIIWGMTYNGVNGVKHVLQILKDELDIAMALAGCRTLDDIKSQMVIKEDKYSKL